MKIDHVPNGTVLVRITRAPDGVPSEIRDALIGQIVPIVPERTARSLWKARDERVIGCPVPAGYVFVPRGAIACALRSVGRDEYGLKIKEYTCGMYYALELGACEIVTTAK